MSFHLVFFFPSFKHCWHSRNSHSCGGDLLEVTSGAPWQLSSHARDRVQRPLHEGDRACHWKGLTVSEPGLKWGHRGRRGADCAVLLLVVLVALGSFVAVNPRGGREASEGSPS